MLAVICTLFILFYLIYCRKSRLSLLRLFSIVLYHRPSLSKTLGNLALICQKWSLKLLLLKSGGTRAVQKGAKKALPLIITNSKAKKKGAHFEHLNYHLLSILIVVYHDLFPDAERGKDVIERGLGRDALYARGVAEGVEDHA